MIVCMMFISPTKRTLLIGSLASLMASVTLPLLAADRQVPGQYEFTVTADGKTRTSLYCVTPEDARAVNADAKTGRDYAEKAAKGTCAITLYEVRGDTVSLTMTCGGDSVRATNTTYHGDSFEGDNTYTFTADGKRMVRVSHIKAKRIGVCK